MDIGHKWVHMGHTWVNMDHMYVGSFFEKLIWTRYPMDINISKIPHYLQYVQHQFWVHAFVMIFLIFFWSCFCNKIFLHLHRVFAFNIFISWFGFKTMSTFVNVVLEILLFSSFCAHDIEWPTTWFLDLWPITVTNMISHCHGDGFRV
jgi:hypothetical protein